MLKCVKYHYIRLFDEYLSTAKKLDKYYGLFIAKSGDKFSVKFKAVFQRFSQILRNTTINLRQEIR
jgi:hypothetical protein